MKIKKYIGATDHEAMEKLKRELGPNAVVLNTKTVRGKGILKYFKKPFVEITAAYEESDILKVDYRNSYDEKLNNINRELVELKNIMTKSSMEKEEKDELPHVLEDFKTRLLYNGLDSTVVDYILKDINEEFNLKDKNENTIENIIKYKLMESLGNPQSITMDGNQKTIFFIGPTGVGKTTSLAKIAASLVVKDKYEIGLITSDTYRVGAVDQLKIYSDILNLPLEIAYNRDDMFKAFKKFEHKDIILVDTAGRNHNDIEQIEELKSILESRDTKEVYLLLSATMDKKIIQRLMEKYSFIEDFKLIITKIDESENYGDIFNIRYLTNKELSYYTNGQNVPDDIQVIDKEFIVKKLIKENIYNGSS